MNNFDEKPLRALWAAYTSPFAHTLSLVLGDVQKDGYPHGYCDWKEFVCDVMAAMEAADGGQFPESWYDEDA